MKEEFEDWAILKALNDSNINYPNINKLNDGNIHYFLDYLYNDCDIPYYTTTLFYKHASDVIVTKYPKVLDKSLAQQMTHLSEEDILKHNKLYNEKDLSDFIIKNFDSRIIGISTSRKLPFINKTIIDLVYSKRIFNDIPYSSSAYIIFVEKLTEECEEYLLSKLELIEDNQILLEMIFYKNPIKYRYIYDAILKHNDKDSIKHLTSLYKHEDDYYKTMIDNYYDEKIIMDFVMSVGNSLELIDYIFETNKTNLIIDYYSFFKIRYKLHIYFKHGHFKHDVLWDCDFIEKFMENREHASICIDCGHIDILNKYKTSHDYYILAEILEKHPNNSEIVKWILENRDYDYSIWIRYLANNDDEETTLKLFDKYKNNINFVKSILKSTTSEKVLDKVKELSLEIKNPVIWYDFLKRDMNPELVIDIIDKFNFDQSILSLIAEYNTNEKVLLYLYDLIKTIPSGWNIHNIYENLLTKRIDKISYDLANSEDVYLSFKANYNLYEIEQFNLSLIE